MWQNKKDTDIEFRIVIEVPTSIGNEIKNVTKDNIWTFVVEDYFGRHEMSLTGIDDYMETDSDKSYQPYVAILSIVLLAIYLIYRYTNIKSLG